MSSDFKNFLSSFRRAEVSVKDIPEPSYEPEYKRLNVEPQKGGNLNPDFSKKRAPLKTPQVPQTLPEDEKVFIRGTAFQAPATSTLPVSGFSREQVWRPESSEEKQEKIIYDEVLSPPSQLNISPGHYILVIEGEPVHSSQSLDELEELLEQLLFSPDSPFKELKMEDVAVYTRLDLKIGVIIKK